jgi:hypothetical protein
MKSQAAAEAHERDCVMLEHGRIIPRDVPITIIAHKAQGDTLDNITRHPAPCGWVKEQMDKMPGSILRIDNLIMGTP